MYILLIWFRGVAKGLMPHAYVIYLKLIHLKMDFKFLKYLLSLWSPIYGYMVRYPPK